MTMQTFTFTTIGDEVGSTEFQVPTLYFHFAQNLFISHCKKPLFYIHLCQPIQLFDQFINQHIIGVKDKQGKKNF
jgi:hypothetical protein